MEYQDLPIDMQIKVDHLVSYHKNKYPLSWYESLPIKQILAMHNEYLIDVSKNIEKYGG